MRFKKQTLTLPIVNFEKSSEIAPSKHGKLLPNTIRALICGPSNCGKTNLMFTLLTDINGLRFENVYVYSKSLHQCKYQLLVDVLRGVQGVQLFTYENGDDVPSVDNILPNSVFIFDDVVMEKQNVMCDYFARGRHRQVDVFFLSQTLSRIQKQMLRDNTNVVVLFRQDEVNLRHAYDEYVCCDMKFGEFKEFCKECWNKDRYGFAVICLDFARDDGRYRYKFDTFVTI